MKDVADVHLLLIILLSETCHVSKQFFPESEHENTSVIEHSNMKLRYILELFCNTTREKTRFTRKTRILDIGGSTVASVGGAETC